MSDQNEKLKQLKTSSMDRRLSIAKASLLAGTRWAASSASSTNIMVDSGSCSEGFKTKVLPQTIAIGNIHNGIIAGKLNGVIPAQTPSG